MPDLGGHRDSDTPCECRRGFGRRLLTAAIALPFVGTALRRAGAQETEAAGDDKTMKSHIIDAGADLLQNKEPIDAMSVYLNGFHFYADDRGRQVEAHHFCTHLTEDFHQCVIFDADDKKARLIGIEYIVSAKLFQTLPDEEKKLWHSHHYEIKSGQLVIPGVPERVERSAFKDLVTTYGKTWHTWQIDRDNALPLGIPQLMMGFTDDGQIDSSLLKSRDERLDVSSEERRRSREEIPMPTVDPLANAWQGGRTMQLKIEQAPLK